MHRVQYVSQVAVPDHEVNRLADGEQDQFIAELGEQMTRDMREKTMDARPLSEVGYQVTGPHYDPLQGAIHVHTIAAWFDLDTIHPEAEFRRMWLEANREGGPSHDPHS